jgi:hypothetical protein
VKRFTRRHRRGRTSASSIETSSGQQMGSKRLEPHRVAMRSRPGGHYRTASTVRSRVHRCARCDRWSGLSRRRSRVRVPSLPSLGVPAKRHLVLPQQADVARLGQQTGSTFVLSRVQECLQIRPSQGPLGCASERLRDSVRSGNMTSGVFMASADTEGFHLLVRTGHSVPRAGTRVGHRLRSTPANSRASTSPRTAGRLTEHESTPQMFSTSRSP